MIERLEKVLEKYNELKEELVKPENLNDYNKLKKLSKEQSDLEEIVNAYEEYKNTELKIKDATEFLKKKICKNN